MIIKRNLSPIKILRYIRAEMIFSVVLSIIVYLLYKSGVLVLSLPFSLSAILGSALAIFIGFRNNTAYSRWWEARTLWANIANSSRSFARQIIANADNAVAIGKATKEKTEAYKQEIIHRQIAFAHALRLRLREESITVKALTLPPGNHHVATTEEIRHLLTQEEFMWVVGKSNIPNMLLQKQGIRIKEGMKDEILGGFDNISLEPTLATFNTLQGSCERIKETPLLRQYDYFTRLFLVVFMLLLPFTLIGDFTKMGIDVLVIPISITIAFVFNTIAKVGAANEDPFENLITDVPLTAICNAIERDLKEMLGEDLPLKIEAHKGYLM
jgi:putative membrane protein